MKFQKRIARVLLVFVLVGEIVSAGILPPFVQPLASVKIAISEVPVAAVPAAKSVDPSENGLFFDALAPQISGPGSVKTIPIKVSGPASRRQQLRGGSGRYVPASLDPYNGEKFLRPVSGGRISSPYGRRFHPKFKKTHFHSGIDIAVPHGSPIRAAAGGVVTFIGWRAGYGLMVKINHGSDLETVYAHCSKIHVKPGDRVKRAEHIANVGRTGVTTGSHLHFEVLRQGNTRNPSRYLP